MFQEQEKHYWFSGMTFIREEGKKPGNFFPCSFPGKGYYSPTPAKMQISESKALDAVCEIHRASLPWHMRKESVLETQRLKIKHAGQLQKLTPQSLFDKTSLPKTPEEPL